MAVGSVTSEVPYGRDQEGKGGGLVDCARGKSSEGDMVQNSIAPVGYSIARTGIPWQNCIAL